MSGKTHAIIGANAIWIAALAPSIDEKTILLGIVGALAGLLPDIDAANAKIHYVAKGVFGAFRGIAPHRGFFHSLLAILLMFIFSLLFLRQFHPLIPFAFTLGYASHILIDALNKPGVQFLFPQKKRYRIVPRAMATNVNGPLDHALFILGAMTFVLFVMEYGLTNLKYF